MKIIGLLVVVSLSGAAFAQSKKEVKKEKIEKELDKTLDQKNVPVEQAGDSAPGSQPVEPDTGALPAKPKAQSDKKEDEADQVITNRRLRADSGSLSKWSGAMFFNYQGGSVADPLKPERPNITNGKDALTLQNLTGELGIRYRLTSLDSITASTGFFMTTPFHSSIDTDNAALEKSFDENSQELNVADPFLKYVHLDRVWTLQSVTTLKPLLITNNQQKELGYKASYFISQVFMKDAGRGFSYGGAFQGTWYDFSEYNSRTSRNVIGFYPAAEYVLNDTFNLRTVFGWQVYEQYRTQENGTWTKRKVYQSVGVGISLSRDVFLYPNIQYIPSDIRSDRTNIAISANVNVF